MGNTSFNQTPLGGNFSGILAGSVIRNTSLSVTGNTYVGSVTFTGSDFLEIASMWSASDPAKMVIPAGVNRAELTFELYSDNSSNSQLELYIVKNGAVGSGSGTTVAHNTPYPYGAFGSAVSTGVLAVTPGDYFTVGFWVGSSHTIGAGNIRLTLKCWQSNSIGTGPINIIDLSSASQDYPLAIGETAKVLYTNATSVPLKVAVFGTEYEVILKSSARTIGTYSGASVFQPNNTTYTNGFDSRFIYKDSADADVGGIYTPSAYEQGFVGSSIGLGEDLIQRCKMEIQTDIANKCVQWQVTERLSATSGRYRIGDTTWSDTTTAWTSLGKFVFANAMSGTVIIKRIM